MKTLIALILWTLLFLVCWPLAFLVLLAWPIVWLLSIPFRLVGAVVAGLLSLVHAVLLLPGRLLGLAGPRS